MYSPIESSVKNLFIFEDPLKAFNACPSTLSIANDCPKNCIFSQTDKNDCVVRRVLMHLEEKTMQERTSLIWFVRGITNVFRILGNERKGLTEERYLNL